MPDILAYGFLHSACLDRVAEEGRRDAIRVKRVDDFEIAREWLQLRAFDALLLPAELPIPEQQELSELLWAKQKLARLIVVAAESADPNQRYGPRLLGAEVTSASSLSELLRHLVRHSTTPEGTAAESMYVFVVEDLDAPRDIICSFVESVGFRNVEGFDSAREVLNRLRSDPKLCGSVCVLTDLKMPEFSGQELIEEMRSDVALRRVPIIVLTAHGTADSLIDCLKAGASGFLVKPPKKDDLLRELRRAQRISVHSLDPALATSQEADLLRDLLAQRGIL